MLVPTGPVTVRLTVLVEVLVYTWLKVVETVLLVTPSPKSQKRLVMVPVEVSVKLTVSGQAPFVGVAVKLAAGTAAPTPVTGFVLLPSLPVVKITTLLKFAALAGLNRTMTFVEP